MKKALVLVVVLVVAGGSIARAVGLGPVALGFHLIPAIERQDGRRALDLSLSLGATLILSTADSIEFTAIIDSGPTALGTTVIYHRDVTDHVELGVGLTALWPITPAATFQTPLFESFAHAAVHDAVGFGLSAEAAASLPVLTVARTAERWSIIPLAELPSLSLAGDVRLAERGSLKLQLTLQPVIMDTTLLVEPYGRVTDDLLVLPMFSMFTRYMP
jgi:hypothetical protein